MQCEHWSFVLTFNLIYSIYRSEQRGKTAEAGAGRGAKPSFSTTYQKRSPALFAVKVDAALCSALDAGSCRLPADGLPAPHRALLVRPRNADGEANRRRAAVRINDGVHSSNVRSCGLVSRLNRRTRAAHETLQDDRLTQTPHEGSSTWEQVAQRPSFEDLKHR